MSKDPFDISSIELEPTEPQTTCPGKVFRCSESTYHYEDRGAVIWGTKTVMRQLKKKSCPGCKHCGYLLDELGEFDEIDIRPYTENGALYKLEVVDVSTDWESGLADDWNLAFIKVGNNELCKL